MHSFVNVWTRFQAFLKVLPFSIFQAPSTPINIVVSPQAGTSTELSPGIQTLQQPIESKLTPKKKRTPNKKPTPASEAVSAVKDYVARLMAHKVWINSGFFWDGFPVWASGLILRDLEFLGPIN